MFFHFLKVEYPTAGLQYVDLQGNPLVQEGVLSDIVPGDSAAASATANGRQVIAVIREDSKDPPLYHHLPPPPQYVSLTPSEAAEQSGPPQIVDASAVAHSRPDEPARILVAAPSRPDPLQAAVDSAEVNKTDGGVLLPLDGRSESRGNIYDPNIHGQVRKAMTTTHDVREH